jgi:hypothetical protein
MQPPAAKVREALAIICERSMTCGRSTWIIGASESTTTIRSIYESLTTDLHDEQLRSGPKIFARRHGESEMRTWRYIIIDGGNITADKQVAWWGLLIGLAEEA